MSKNVNSPEWKWELKDDEVMEIRNSEGVQVNVTAPATVYADVSKHRGANVIMNFSQALDVLKQGKKVARKGWNGKGMFIYLVKGQEVAKCNLRNEAREHFKAKDHHHEEITINSHIDMKAADGSIVVGWLASQTDMLAEDWVVIVDE